MIRALYGVSRSANLAHEDFMQFWNSAQFQDLVDEFIRIYRIDKLQRNRTLQLGLNDLIVARQGIAHSVDGLIEAFWKEPGHVMAVNESDEAMALKARWAQAESGFVDRERSFLIFTAAD